MATIETQDQTDSMKKNSLRAWIESCDILIWANVKISKAQINKKNRSE